MQVNVIWELMVDGWEGHWRKLSGRLFPNDISTARMVDGRIAIFGRDLVGNL
jgi:hypothetical protein